MVQSIPSDAHAAGDAGHPTDHNNICDMLSLYGNALAELAGIPSAADTSNIAAINAGLVDNRGYGPGPWWSTQIGAGSWNFNNTWVDYGVGNWPTVTFTGPASGLIFVTISAGPISNTSGTSAIGYHIIGTDTLGYNLLRAVSIGAVSGGGGIRASRRTIIAVTPGGTSTVIPAWFQTQSGGNDTADGQLLVEAVL